MRVERAGSVLAAFVAAASVSVAAADVPERVEPDGTRFAGEKSFGPPADSRGSSRLKTSGAIAAQRLEKKRRSPENKRARARDAMAFGDQDRGGALETLMDSFPEIAKAPPWKPLELGDGDKLLGYLGPNTAKVDGEDGGVQIVDSQLPLQARPRGGGPIEPVSYDMLSSGEVFRPANPLTETLIHKDLEKGIEFPEQGFAVRPSGAASTDPPMRVGDKVLFANLVEDTDLFVVPTPTGAETVLHVRSRQAPESSTLELMLEDGQRVRPVVGDSRGAPGSGRGGSGPLGSLPGGRQPGSFEIVDADGKPVAQIPLPNGVDAAGRAVPVTMTLEGRDRLVLSYPHDDPALEFPLAIDPIVDAYGINPYNGARVNDYDPFLYWDYWANDYYNTNIRKNNPDATAFGEIRNQGAGLYVVSEGQYYYYRHLTTGEWIWPAPGRSFVRRADFGYVTNAPQNTCLLEGIWSPSRFAWDTGRWEHPAGQPAPSGGSPWSMYSPYDGRAVNANACSTMSNNYKAHYIDNPTPGNQVVFGMQALGDGTRAVQPYVYLYGASMWLDDGENPTTGAPQHVYQLADGVIRNGLPTDWVKDANLGSGTDVSDPGLGVRRVNLLENGGFRKASTHPCTGGKDYRCPTYWPSSANRVNYTAAELGEGVHNLSLNAADVVEHTSGPTGGWQVKVDRSVPTAASISNPPSRISGPVDLQIAGADAVSGVASAQLMVNGAPRGPVKTFPASGPGAFGGAITFDPAGLPSGVQKVSVQLRDRAQNARDSATVDVRVVDPDAPTITVTGGLRSSPLTSGRSLRIVGQDARPGILRVTLSMKPVAQGAPLEKEQTGTVVLDSDPNGCGPCPTSRTAGYTLPDGTAPGRYLMTAAAFEDDSGRAPTLDQWEIQVVAQRDTDRKKLGLEQWFELDSTDAGGGSSLHVNGETGNAVWHGVPVVNPGRGLASVVNLTYTPQARGGLLGGAAGRVPVISSIAGEDADDALGVDLIGSSYRQAGTGFSIAVSGPTRINEPLAGVAIGALTEFGEQIPANIPGSGSAQPRILMTDADGTRHDFQWEPNGRRWVTPPGVNMRLRYTGPRPGSPGAASSLATLLAATASLTDLEGEGANGRAWWELTRSDGVKHLFDRNGYLQATRDRNANTIDYRYESVNQLNGAPCQDGGTPLVGLITSAAKLCAPRLREVVHYEAGRTEPPESGQETGVTSRLVRTGLAPSGACRSFAACLARTTR